MDIEWLQKDFGLYIVNMFDTGQAAKTLNLPSKSLAFLLKKYCDITANKEYQQADWRRRPLTKEMMKYAREDTHYLLNIYDKIRGEIVSWSIRSGLNPIESLKSVLNQSRLICLKTYQKPELKTETYYELLNRYKSSGNETKVQIFKEVYKWRDHTARIEDENPHSILP
jgi:exosome complex exonuclease RRP6